MKREPSLHIYKGRLALILSDIMPIGVDVPRLTNEIMNRARAYSLSTRSISVTNDRVEKKVNKIIKSSRLDSDLFAQLLYGLRKQLKHRGISTIRPGSRDWETIKEISGMAINFSMEFQLDRREGFIEFIKIGLGKMQKFALTKFLGMYEGICDAYISYKEIQDDDDPGATREMYDYYTRIIAEKTGIVERIDELPEKYVWFVRARQQADKIMVNPRIYIKAQFEALDFAKGIPHPIQMVGPKATDRVNRYAFQRGIVNDNVVNMASKLKDIFKHEDPSD